MSRQKNQYSLFMVGVIFLISGVFGVRVGNSQSSDGQRIPNSQIQEQGMLSNTLTIVIEPPGAGSVSKNPNKPVYDEGEKVRLTANGSGGYSFFHWSGGVDRYTYNPLDIYMEESRTIQANFVKQDPSKISKPNKPSGPTSATTGQVLDISSGGATSYIGGQVEYIFDWGDAKVSEWGSADRSHAYGKAGTYDVRVRARSTSEPNTVSEWSGTLEVHVSGGDKHILEIFINPEGAGHVVIDPEKEGYDDGDIVNLRAVANGGYSFSSWSGGLVSTSNPVNIYMFKSRSITANFSGGGGGETVSTPDTPSGPSTGDVGEVLTYSTGGSVSSLGHDVEYQFDWGDGTKSSWNGSTRTTNYGSPGTYQVKARARCQAHTDIVSGWSNSREVTISGTAETYTLTVQVDPGGSGTVDVSPDKASYEYNEEVELTAIAEPGFQFDSWSGDLTGNTNPVTINMQQNRTVTANFTSGGETVSTPDTPAGPSTGIPGENLDFTTGGSTSSLGHTVEYQFDWGDGNSSSWGNSDGTHSYNNTGSYQVRARARCADHTGVISGWSGSKTVNISESTETYVLTVLVEPEGGGTVTKNPDKDEYNADEPVELEAFPNTDYRFDHWSGDIDPYTMNPITIYMRRDRTIIANFVYEGSETVSIPDTPTGPTSANTGENLTFVTGGSVSNMGHPVEYQFDWGDGNQSEWGDSSADYSYGNAGIYLIKARARCSLDVGVMSDWSGSLEAEISGFTINYTLTINASPESAGVVLANPLKSTYEQGEIVNLFAIPTGGNGVLDDNIYLEGESGQIDGNFGVDYDTSASGNYYLYGTNGEPRDGSAVYDFEITTAGDYMIWGRCFALSNAEDSFFILADNGDTLTWHLDTNYGEWIWQKISHMYQEQLFNFDVGSHTLTVIKRDLNARLDKIIITSDPGFVPQGKAEIPPGDFTYYFDSWGGDLSGNENPVELIMSSDKVVTGYFGMEGAEIVTPPTTLTGPDSGFVGQSLTFQTSGASSNLGNDVSYQFDWGDGSFSGWGTGTESHAYLSENTFTVKSRARSQADTTAISAWSGSHSVIIVEEPVIVYTLNITISPEGTGSVTKTPDKAEYFPGESVSLRATPGDGYLFDEWSGDATGMDNPVVVEMNSDKNITASFIELIESVSTPTTPTGPDSGAIGENLTFTTGGSICSFGHEVEYQFDWGDSTLSDWGEASRQHIYSYSDSIKIKARARCKENPLIISDWSGFFTVNIIPSYSYVLTITVDPLLSGSVNKTPLKDNYNQGETVILSPLAASGYVFESWSGDITGESNPAFIVMDGNKSVVAHFRVLSDVEIEKNTVPEKFELVQNFPNPFNPETTIRYQLPEADQVSLTVYNMQGQVVQTLVDGYQEAGYYNVKWNARDFSESKVPSGIYVYRIQFKNQVQTKKMLLIK